LAGGDIAWFLKHPTQLAQMKSMKNIHHIAISRCLEKDLKVMGVPYKFLPINVHSNSDIKPEPLGNFIYFYRDKDPQFNPELVDQLEKRLPYIRFIRSKSVTDYTREQVLDIYKDCFLGLRFTKHDGLPNTVCEMGLMGRRVIHNGDTPNCIWYDESNIDSIVKLIQEEYENRHNVDYIHVAEAVRSYLDIGTKFLDTEFYD
jgi:hypothetical protein